MSGYRKIALCCSAVFAVSILTFPAAASVQTNLPVSLYDSEQDDDGVMVFYDRNSGELPADFEIPSVFEGKPVYGIADEGFVGLKELVHVTIPGSVVLIGKHAFGSCTNLQQVDFSSGLIGIDDSAFDYCSALKSVVLPDTVTNLGGSAFAISGLQSVQFSQNLAVMGQGCFYKCNNLTEVSLPASLKTVGDQAFRSCANLKTATVAGPVCAELMFGDCPKLESVTFLDPACEICGYGSTICNEVTQTARGAYNGVIRGYTGSTAQEYAEKWNYRFEALDAVEPPPVDISGMPAEFDKDRKYTANGVCYEYMNGYALICGFVSGQLTEKLVLPETVAGVPVLEIGEEAFAGMSGVQSVTVPLRVEKIGTGAFTNCPELKEVIVRNPELEISSKGAAFSNDSTGKFSGVLYGYVPSQLRGYTAMREIAFLELDQVKGDATLDGIVSIDDAQTVLKAYTETVAGKELAMNKIQKSTSDADGNASISVEDAQLILKYYTEKSVAGRDITWADLLKEVTV